MSKKTGSASLVKNGAFAWANKQLGMMVGRNDHLENVKLSDIVGFDDLLDISKTDLSCGGIRKDGQIVTDGLMKDIRALGQIVDLSHTESGTVWVIEDVSEQKQLEQLKENIDQIVRHDLKSPLATIRILTSAMKETGQLNEHQTKLINMIYESATTGMQSLTTALVLYQIEAGKFIPKASETDLLLSIADAIHELSPYLQNGLKTIQIKPFDGAFASRIVVNCDRYLLHTVLVNLMKNALEAIKEQGEVSIFLENRDRYYCARITNPGEVPVEIRERFFEKFVTIGKRRGTGLGTYSAQLIARAFGGKIELDTATAGFTTVTACFKKIIG